MQQHQDEGVVTAMSSATDAEAVAQDLARQLIHPHLGFVLFFCSAEYDLPALGAALEQYFGGIELVGCTSAGEITPNGYGRGCVGAVGFDYRSFSIGCALIDEMERFSLIDAQQLVERLVGDCRSNSWRRSGPQLRPDPAGRPLQPRGSGARRPQRRLRQHPAFRRLGR